jgi:hypothetical protein
MNRSIRAGESRLFQHPARGHDKVSRDGLNGSSNVTPLSMLADFRQFHHDRAGDGEDGAAFLDRLNTSLKQAPDILTSWVI